MNPELRVERKRERASTREKEGEGKREGMRVEEWEKTNGDVKQNGASDW